MTLLLNVREFLIQQIFIKKKHLPRNKYFSALILKCGQLQRDPAQGAFEYLSIFELFFRIHPKNLSGDRIWNIN